MTIYTRVISASVSIVACLVSGSLALAGEKIQTVKMQHFEDASFIEDTEAMLTRMDSGIYMSIDTVGLTPGHAVTAWFVVFNNPAACSGDECGEDDIFNMDADGKFILNADGSPPMNGGGIEAAGISALRADGLVIDIDGKAQFLGRLPIGDPSEAIFGSGMANAHAAEIHAVIRDHSDAKPGKVNEMVNSFNGGCADSFPFAPCTDLQFAIFKPAM